MDDLVTFLRAALDDDEQIARAALPGPWHVNDEALVETIYSADDVAVVAGGRWGGEAPVFDSDADAVHIVRHDPARVLREVAAKRAIADSYDEDEDRVTFGHWTSCSDSCPGNVIYEVVKLLASVYADRPGYRPEWAQEVQT